MIEGPNQVQTSPNFVGMIHKGLVNMSTEGIDESLHGLGGIEEFQNKNGVLSITRKAQELRS